MNNFKRNIYRTIINDVVVDNICYSVTGGISRLVTTECLGIGYDDIEYSYTLSLKDSSGNLVIADIDYSFEIEVREKSVGVPTETIYNETIIILQGNSSVIFGNFYNKYQDNGQGGCEQIYREYTGVISPIVELGGIFIPSCEVQTIE